MCKHKLWKISQYGTKTEMSSVFTQQHILLLHSKTTTANIIVSMNSKHTVITEAIISQNDPLIPPTKNFTPYF